LERRRKIADNSNIHDISSFLCALFLRKPM
jgi:hypothetical protein